MRAAGVRANSCVPARKQQAGLLAPARMDAAGALALARVLVCRAIAGGVRAWVHVWACKLVQPNLEKMIEECARKLEGGGEM